MGVQKDLIKLTSKERLYNLDVPIIGLTGGIATGKSEVSKRLAGKPIIDADANVKEIYSSQESLDFIKDNFPQAIAEDSINFKVLREIAFNNAKNKEMIEAYIYQRLPQKFMEAFQALGSPDYVIYDVPLLYEKGLDKLVDIKVTVYCPRKTQIERLLKRDSIDKPLAEKILNSQWDIEKKKEESDYFIDNSSSLENLDKNIQSVFSKILN